MKIERTSAEGQIYSELN